MECPPKTARHHFGVLISHARKEPSVQHECRVLCLKLTLGLEERGNQVQEEELSARPSRPTLGDSVMRIKTDGVFRYRHIKGMLFSLQPLQLPL